MGGFLDYVLIDFYSTCNFRALQRWVTLTPSGNAVKLRVNDINLAGYGEFRRRHTASTGRQCFPGSAKRESCRYDGPLGVAFLHFQVGFGDFSDLCRIPPCTAGLSHRKRRSTGLM